MNYALPRLTLLLILLISFANPSVMVHAGSPDLTVDSIWLEDASQTGQPISEVSPGQSFNIIATIRNIGQETAAGYCLDVYYDGDYGRGGPDNIAPGEVQTWYVGPLTAQAGTHTTKWVVDPDNLIVELGELNNQREFVFTVGSQTVTTAVTSSSTSSVTQLTSTSTSSTSESTSTSTSYSTESTSTELTSTTTTTMTSSSTFSTTQSTGSTTTTLNAISNPLVAGQTGVAFSGSVSPAFVPDGVNVELHYASTCLQGSGGTVAITFPVVIQTSGGNGAFGGSFTAPAAGTYQFWAYFVGGSGYGSSSSACQPITVTNNPATVSITVTANPSSSIVVDGTTYTSPQTFTWVPGSSHTISANSPVSSAPGTQYVWTSWADGGDQSRTVMAPSSPTTYTANYQTQYQVTFAVNPSGGGAITVNGQPSVTSWYDDGAVVSVQASSNAGYGFSSWSSDTASIVFADSSSPSMTVTIHGTGTVTANFLLQDATPPVITSTVSPSANSNGWNSGPITVSWSVSDSESGIASSTACTTTTVSAETSLAGTTLTCTATNGAGLSNSASVTVKIDLTAPTLTLPSTVTAEATSPSGATVSYAASASDSSSGIAGFSCTPASGSTFPITTTAVSCSATDKAGNTATGTFNVSVQDKTPPVVTVPSDMTKQAAIPNGVVVSYAATASDLVDGSITPICTPSSGSTFPLASTKVTCTATDKAGNTGSASFKVTVVDTTPPKLTIPSDMTVQASSSGAVVTFSASASDLVDGSIPITCTPASGSTFPLGTTTVTCSATDKTGNRASGSFKVTVTPSSSTVTVTVKLLASNNNGLSGGAVRYYSSGWQSFGTTGSDGTVSMALLSGTYTFEVSYAGVSQQKSQNVAANPNVVFQTTLVTMKLLSSANTELAGVVRYSANGWHTFGSGSTTTSMELLPFTYTFEVRYGGVSQQKSQNVAANPNVVFQTVQVHSDSGKCTSYYAGGWRTFTQDMELLPGSYKFHFSDGTKNTSYTLVVGAVKHIH